ncbi:TFIIB-type zinc ribbon-containing protein [Halomicrobium sp. IBSBa]|uniref:DUF7117 family protein n=1 Tax=Halomicrobium sp. IBSBa TaxID=2778916 RepID=UPI001ABF55BF|nr:TFIIB-type zinc ribbon-containing protein [Halomicrobium sp. IBSBa]MBO4248217.1 TFIIB-type zinc ribbon-containing protein [Halomicrobium sp. IBSBa]
MKVRGHRECKACGSRWSYYETASVECPDCGSLRSVGVDDRTRHTNAPVEYDLTPVRGSIDEQPLEEIATDAAEQSSEYVRQRGFVDGGSLLALDETFVAATELGHVASEIARTLQPTDAQELYFFTLLRGADEGERPAPREVPSELRPSYGLAMMAAVEAYQRDLRAYLDDEPDPQARSLSGRIRDHRKRIEALDGDVDPKDADRLVHAARDLGQYLAAGDESALVTADNWLNGVEQ